jgi:hypothetical protein
VGLEHVSLSELWVGWSVYWTLVFGLVLCYEGPKDRLGMIGSVGTGAGAGAFAGALFGGGMWLIMRAKYGF